MTKPQLRKLIQQVKASGEIIVIDDYASIIYSIFFSFMGMLILDILTIVKFKFWGVVIGNLSGYIIVKLTIYLTKKAYNQEAV